MAFGLRGRVLLTVTPAKAGVQGNQRALATLDPGFRRDDDEKQRRTKPYAMTLPYHGAGLTARRGRGKR
jgi:hypothetical protein